MANKFKKLMIEQVQESLNPFSALIKKTVPLRGWIHTLRKALSMSSAVLANRIGCSRSSVINFELNERKKTITLKTLEKVAQAMNCKLVYCLVPLEPLEQQLQNQARLVAQRQIRLINHSMKLEQQALSSKQLQQQEDELVQELLQGSLKNLWENDEI